MNETRDRVEDSLFAVRAAIEEGYVVGGGFALASVSRDLLIDEISEMERIGFKIV